MQSKKLKIFYIANARMPTERAHGIQLAKMCEAFVKNGVDLELIVPKRKNIGDSLRSFYGLDTDIRLHKLKVVDFYNWGKFGFVISSFTFAFRYYFYCRKMRKAYPEALFYTIDMDQFSFFMMPFIGRPYFIEIHDAKDYGFFYNILFKRAKGIIVINNLIKETICKNFNLSENKFLVKPNGIDMKFFDIGMDKLVVRQKLGIDYKGKIALYSGKIYDWKGLQILSEASKYLTKDVRIYIVGGSREEYIESSGEEPASEIFFVGSRPYTEMPLWLAAADVLLVLGTKSNRYSYYFTSPMKVFEYMASKRPIVASATPALKQIVSEDDVIFYECDNAKSLADSIESSFEEKNRIVKAYEKSLWFEWHKRAKEVLSFIQKPVIGIVIHPYNEREPAGLGRFIRDISFKLASSNQERRYVFIIKEPVKDKSIFPQNVEVADFGFRTLWMDRSIRKLPYLDVCIFNTPIMPIFFNPQKSIVIALDYAYWFYFEGFKGFLRRYVLFLYNWFSINGATHVVAISEATKKDTVSLFNIEPTKISVIYPGFNKMEEVAAKPPEFKYFLFIGVIKERKNVNNIVKAFECFKEKSGLPYKLVIAGKLRGPYGKKIERMIERSRFKNDIIVKGFVNDKEVPALYVNAQALIFPSLLEGFGFPILEAMSIDVPVITSNVSSLVEIAGTAALLVDPKSISEIASAMEKVIVPEVRDRLIKQGRQRIHFFSYDKTVEQFIHLIDKL